MIPPNTVKSQIAKRVKENADSRQRMSRNLVVRVSDNLYSRLEEMAGILSEETPGRRTTVSDVARAILEYGTRKRDSDILFRRRNTETED